MRASDPPAFATWLISQLVSGAKTESLIGDLVEQHRRGRSSTWFWWQAISVIVTFRAGITICVTGVAPGSSELPRSPRRTFVTKVVNCRVSGSSRCPAVFSATNAAGMVPATMSDAGSA